MIKWMHLFQHVAYFKGPACNKEIEFFEINIKNINIHKKKYILRFVH